MEKKKLSMKKTSNRFKIFAALFCIGLILYKVIKTDNLTTDYALACGVASIIIANIFITVDIAVWKDNMNKIKEVTNDVINKD
jgi:hypothetical protein